MAFLDGNQPQRLCEPLKQYIEARGGKVLLNKPLRRIEVNEDGTVRALRIGGGKDGSVRIRLGCGVSRLSASRGFPCGEPSTPMGRAPVPSAPRVLLATPAVPTCHFTTLL